MKRGDKRMKICRLIVGLVIDLFSVWRSGIERGQKGGDE